MKVNGAKIRLIGDERTGVSRKGNNFRVASVVLDVPHGDYTESFVATAMNETLALVEQFNTGALVDVQMWGSVREYNGRYYPEFRISTIEYAKNQA